MPPQGTKAVTWGPTTWVKGDRGRLQPHVTDRAKLINFRVHPNGYLSPRIPWQDGGLSFTAAAHSSASANFMAGNFDDGEGNLTPGVLAASAAGLEFMELDGTQHATYGSGSGLPTTLVRNAWPSRAEEGQYILNEWIFTLKMAGTNIVPAINTVNALTSMVATIYAGLNSFTAFGSVLHQSRLFIWGEYYLPSSVFDTAGSGSLEPTDTYIHQNRLHYSDPNNYGTFTDSTQFLEFDFDIAGAFSMGSSLFIWSAEGDWWMLQGRGDPDDGTLNYIGRFKVPGTGNRPSLINNQGTFLSSDLTTIVTFTEGGEFSENDGTFLGLQDDGVSYAQSDDTAQQTSSSVMGSTLISAGGVGNSGSISRHRWNGVWSEEDWGGIPADYTTVDYYVESLPSEDREILLVRRTSNNTWYGFYRNVAEEELPTTQFDIEDDMTSELHLPLIVNPSGLVRMGRIIVDVLAHKPQADDSAIVATVHNGDGTTTAFNMLAPSATALTGLTFGGAPKHLRLEFTPSEMAPATHRAEIRLTGIRFMAIEQVTAWFTDGEEQYE